jgi:uncharacterized membrane protein (Fun14 family)
VGAGTAIGLVMGFALERFMNAMLFNGGLDLTVYFIVVPAMVLATMLAASRSRRSWPWRPASS